MAPTLNDYEYQFGDSGFLLNGDDATFPFFDITQISGLDTAPIRINTDDRQGSDGTYVDAEYMSQRTVVITGTLYTDPSDTSACDTIRSQFGPSPVQPFYFQEPGVGMRFLNAQGGGAQFDEDNSRGLGMTEMQLTLLAGDPYIYDILANSDVADLSATPSIGIGFNIGFNTGFGGTLLEPSATVPNNGSHDAYPVYTLYGPLVNPVVTDSLSTIVMAFQITLGASDYLVVDCRNKKVTLDNQVSRRQVLQGRQWFVVPKGTVDTFFLSADSGSGKMIVDLYNTYQ